MKKGVFYFHRPDADVAHAKLMWHGAYVARGTTARMRCGTESTWQSRGWPTRGAGGAQGAYTWQEATRVHAGPPDARVGCHMAGGGGSAFGGPTG